MDARFSIKVGKTTDILSRVPTGVHEIDVTDNKMLDSRQGGQSETS